MKKEKEKGGKVGEGEIIIKGREKIKNECE